MISTVEHDTVRAGNIIETLTVDGESLVHIALALEDPVLRFADTTRATLLDLHAVAQFSHQRTSAGSIRFQPGQVKGWLQLENGDTVAIDVRLPTPSYNADNFDLLVRAADLQEGMRVELPGFSLFANAVVPLRGRVTGTEVIGGHPCWVFKGTTGTAPITFWVDRETRQLRQQLLLLGGGYALLKTDRPAGEVASLTDEERNGMVLDSTGLRHSRLGFRVAFPGRQYEEFGDMSEALRGMLGRRRDVFVWAYHVPQDPYFGGFAVAVQKGFSGTEEAIRRVPKELLRLGPTGEEASYRDSVVWNSREREFIMVSVDKKGVVSRGRCIAPLQAGTPGVLVCVFLVGGFPEQTGPILKGLEFTASSQ